MIFPDIPRLFFIIFSVLLIIILVIFSINLGRKNNAYKATIIRPISVGVISIIAYILFLLFDSPDSHFYAVLFDTFFFIGTDFLAFFMLLFSIEYTEILKKYSFPIGVICNFICWADTASLLINNVTHHCFDLIYKIDRFGHGFWANEFYAPHYLHLGFCYIMVATTIVLFSISVIKSASVYKIKYSGILIAYAVVILVNMICYSVNLPLDFSVILYGILAGFICFYSTYTFPHKLLNKSLLELNETISDGLLYFDFGGSCIYANRIAKYMFSTNDKYDHKKAEDYRIKMLDELSKKDPDEKYYVSFEIEGELRQYEIEYQKEFYQEIEIGCYIKFIDKTIILETYDKEKYYAIHDDLTGIYNRAGFFEAVDEYVRNNDFSDRLMICSDIKDFKLINEFFGEKVGDQVLIRQAQILTKCAHNDTIYGRLFDDKFAMFIRKEYLNEDIMRKYIADLKTLTESSIYQMHVYVGIYEPEGYIETAQEMCDKAYMAIEEINDNYSEVFAYYDSALMKKLLDEKIIMEEFPFALDRGQIQMYLQPIIDGKAKSFGAEALCRWNHPEKGLLRPAAFLSVLEKSGLIFDLDEYIWDTAAKKIHEWNEMGLNNCYISVNVSEKDFFYTDIYKTFTKLIEKYDIDPEALHIEITEEVLMTDFEKAFTLSKKLQDAGFHISIDNFGNGYSSLNMLKDFKADTIKLDMTFINNAAKVERNQIILEIIITMSKNLNMFVVGEGVENKEQYDVLKKYDCNIYQGNYISEPINIEEYEKNYVLPAKK